MPGHDTDPELVGDHEHQHVINSEFLLEIFSMPGVSETLGHHGLLVDRSRHQHIDVTVLDVLHSALKRPDGRFSRLRSGLSRLDEHIVRKAVDNIDLLWLSILGALDHISVHLVKVMDQFTVETENL